MNKLGFYCAATLVALLGVVASACSDDDAPQKTTPAVAFDESYRTTLDAITFTLTLTDADRGAWMIRERATPPPTAEQVLADGEPLSKPGPHTLTASGLKGATDYTLYAVAAFEGQVGQLVRLDVSTAAYTAMLTLLDARMNAIDYHVETPGTYRHTAVSKQVFDNFASYMPDEKQVVQMLLTLYGCPGSGVQDCSIRDLQENPNNNKQPFDIVAGLEYVVIVGLTDAQGAFDGTYSLESVTLPEPGPLAGKVEVEIVRLAEDEADLRCTPSGDVLYCYEKVFSREQFDGYMTAGGEQAVKEAMFVENTSRVYDFAELSEWAYLTAGTDYLHLVVGVDDRGNQTDLIQTPFTTVAAAEVLTENMLFVHQQSGIYNANVEDALGGRSDNYYFVLSDKPMSPDEYGDPYPDEFPCNVLICDLYTTVSADGTIRIPEGTYTYSENYEAGTWYPDYTWGDHFSATEYETQLDLVGGTITVRYEGGKYHIEIACEREDGKLYTGTYDGPIDFSANSAASAAAMRKPIRKR